jgi:hypothetical protein
MAHQYSNLLINETYTKEYMTLAVRSPFLKSDTANPKFTMHMRRGVSCPYVCAHIDGAQCDIQHISRVLVCGAR